MQYMSCRPATALVVSWLSGSRRPDRLQLAHHLTVMNADVGHGGASEKLPARNGVEVVQL
jgi:hypothetical protein